jgi:lysozyme family protein
MAEFKDAVEYVLVNEGGFVDNPSDSGGATNFGLSLRFLREIPEERRKKYGLFGELTCSTIEHLTHQQAILIYQCEFWVMQGYDQLQNQRVCNYVFDMVIQHGETQGIKIAQRAMWAVMQCSEILKDDGILGVESINLINLHCNDKYFYEAYLAALCSERAGYVRLIAELKPKDKDYLHGWLTRCYKI